MLCVLRGEGDGAIGAVEGEMMGVLDGLGVGGLIGFGAACLMGRDAESWCPLAKDDCWRRLALVDLPITCAGVINFAILDKAYETTGCIARGTEAQYVQSRRDRRLTTVRIDQWIVHLPLPFRSRVQRRIFK